MYIFMYIYIYINIHIYRQLNYRRCELDISDHKPVSALFNIDTGITDPERERTIYTQLLSKVDKWVNASAPKLSVENRVIDYGLIVKQEKKSSVMVIKNVGQVITSWQFVPKPDESVIALPWLLFSSLNGILAPGEVCYLCMYIRVYIGMHMLIYS
jgi:phosphatidylinositol-bisphosphatase